MRDLAALLLLLPGLLAGAALPAQPAPESSPQYQVELLIFAHRPGPTATTEDFFAEADVPAIVPLPVPVFAQAPWGDDDPLAVLEEVLQEALRAAAQREAERDAAAEEEAGEDPLLRVAPIVEPLEEPASLALLPQPSTPTHRRVVETQRLTLSQINGRLANLPGYDPVAHIAWQQFADLPASTPVIIEMDGTAGGKLKGTARLATGATLSLHLDLEYLPDGEQPPHLMLREALVNGVTGRLEIPRYRLREQRRVRLAELHYFDHPAFGVIAVVRRAD